MDTRWWRKRWIAGLAIGSLLLVAAGCGRMQAARALESTPEVTVSLAVVPDPAAGQPGTLQITLRDAAGQPLEAASVAVEADMTHAGMTPLLATAARAGSGRYTAPMTWTMAGDWQITVKVNLADGRALERAFPLRVGAGR